MAQNVRKGHEVARWSEEQEKWVVEMFFTDKVPSISKAKKANGLGARCWRDGEEWPPASLKKAV